MSNAAKQVTTIEQNTAPAIQSEAGSIIAMIERAATNPSVDIDKMERLFKMHGEVIARQARTAYAAALAAMQPELPVIERRGKIGLGNNGKNPTYALWEDINDAIRPVLAKHGFAISFRVSQEDAKFSVTGVLSHKDGHSEQTTMQLPIDTGPGRNAVQSVGSSTSYGKRYTAAALLNLTSRGEDDDGKAAGLGPRITEDDVIQLREIIESVECPMPKFLGHMKVQSLADIPASRLTEARTALNNYKNGKTAR